MEFTWNSPMALARKQIISLSLHFHTGGKPGDTRSSKAAVQRPGLNPSTIQGLFSVLQSFFTELFFTDPPHPVPVIYVREKSKQCLLLCINSAVALTPYSLT